MPIAFPELPDTSVIMDRQIGCAVAVGILAALFIAAVRVAAL